MKHFSFDGLRNDETLELIIFNHPIFLIKPILKSFIFFWLSLGIWKYFGVSQIALGTEVAVFLVGACLISQAFFSLKGSVALVTTQRIILRQQEGFFKRKIAEVELIKIQELAGDLNGVIQNIFGCGDLIIKTVSGDNGQIKIKNVKDPYLAQQKISELLRSQR